MIEYRYNWINHDSHTTTAIVEFCDVERATVRDEFGESEHTIKWVVLEQKKYVFDSILSKVELDKRIDAELIRRKK